MIAGRKPNEEEDMKIAEIKSVLREICPDIGFKSNGSFHGTLTVTGNSVAHLIEILQMLSRLELMCVIGEYGTEAMLTIYPEQKKGTSEITKGDETICVTA